MIGRRHRFHGYGSLNYVYKQGSTTRGPLFSVKSILNERRNEYRLAVVVSRKVSKSAVVRNRIRRRLYEIVRRNENDILRPYDIVLSVFHDSVLDEPATALEQQLKKQLQDAGVMARRIR